MAYKILPGEQAAYEPVIADLFWETGTRVFNEVLNGDISLWRDLCRELWGAEQSLFARSHAYVAVDGGEIVGIVDYLPSDAIVPNFEATLAHIEREVSGDFFQHIQRSFEALGWLFPPVPSDGLAVLHLATAKPHRGKGIGVELMRSAEAVAEGLGLRSIHLDVDAEKTAVEFYRRLGYEAIVETRYLPWSNVHPHLRMVKALSS